MVTIEQEVWGMTPEGEGIIRYTMRNESGASVQLSNYGATILSVVVPDRNGKMDDVVLGYRDAEGYFFDGPAMGKSVGRYANRIALGRMTIEGEKYQLE
ncbi:MAG: galactose-1-epimerase, partial [Alistipes sp.]|nr:galactose-1-epimerase [Alistipes sp.]